VDAIAMRPAERLYRLFGHTDRRRRQGLLLALTLMLLGALCDGLSPVRAELSSLPEYQVKAAFLYNFIKFVDWPGDGSASAGSPICLGMLGRDSFGDALETVRGKTAKGRKIVTTYYRRVEDVKECDVLFISASEKGRLAHILRHLQNSHILTVADQEGFCEAGGMINLIAVKNKVTFEINVEAASRARLRISSQLIKLAKNVVE
jgi:uncharacterized protein DUF4154